MILYLKGAEDDLKKLSLKDRKLFEEQLNKLEKNIYLGKPLTANLKDCRKIYFGQNSELRIVYTIKDNQICIILAIGERNELEVYRLSATRLNRTWR